MNVFRLISQNGLFPRREDVPTSRGACRLCLGLVPPLIAGMLSGCGSDPHADTGPPQAFEMGHTKFFGPDETYVPAPEPGWTLEAPGPQSKIHPGEKFPFTLRLSIPSGSRLPPYLWAYFPTHGQDHPTQYMLLPKRKLGEDLYLFEAKVKSPARPGRYKFWAEAQYSELVQTDPDKKAEMHQTMHRSPTWEVEVRP